MQIPPRVTHMLPSSNERSCPHLHSLQVIGLNVLNCWCAGWEWISDQEFNPKVKLIGSPSVTAGLYLFNHHQFATCGNSVVASRNNSESFSTVAAAFEGFCLLLLCFLFSLLLLHSLTSFISCSHPTPTTSGFLSSPLPWSYLRLHFSN